MASAYQIGAGRISDPLLDLLDLFTRARPRQLEPFELARDEGLRHPEPQVAGAALEHERASDANPW